jgi:hypothetical protein
MQFMGNSSFTQRMLWNGDRVNFKTDWAKKAWLDLMLSTLAQKAAVDAAIAALEGRRQGKLENAFKKSLAISFRGVAVERTTAYLRELEDQMEKFYKIHYAEVLQSDAEADHLRKLQLSSKAEDKKQFSQEIRKLANQRYVESEAKLLAAVSITIEELASAQ